MKQPLEEINMDQIELTEDDYTFVTDGNYMFSWRFIALTVVDIFLSMMGANLFILYPLVSYNNIYEWGLELSLIDAAALYLGSALCFFPVGFYLLHKFNMDLNSNEEMSVSTSRLLISLSPPYFLFSVLGGFILGFGQTITQVYDWILLLYGPGFGFFLARLFYFFYESRFWVIEPVLLQNPSRFRVLDHYIVTRQ